MEKSVTEGIFPGMAGLFSPVGTEQVQRLQAAGQPVDPLQAVSGSMGFLGERMQQGIGSAFGQMPQQDRKRQVFQQLVQQLSQQGVDISTSDGMVQLAQKLSSLPGFEGEALNLRQKAAQMAQQAKMQGLEAEKIRAQTGLAQAQAAKAGIAEKPKLAERLVELETKRATGNLSPKETAELTALQKVVKLQSPKGVDLSGIASVFSKEATEEEAKAVGQQIALIEGKQDSVDKLKAALNILDDGIYTGSFAEWQKELAKKTLGIVGDKARVENTEVFLNSVSANVIPLLQEFGGNDSNEELKFLQRLVGGDITLEEKSLRRILINAIEGIQKGIERTKIKAESIRKGKVPDILPDVSTKQSQKRTTKSGVTYEIIED